MREFLDAIKQSDYRRASGHLADSAYSVGARSIKGLKTAGSITADQLSRAGSPISRVASAAAERAASIGSASGRFASGLSSGSAPSSLAQQGARALRASISRLSRSDSAAGHEAASTGTPGSSQDTSGSSTPVAGQAARGAHPPQSRFASHALRPPPAAYACSEASDEDLFQDVHACGAGSSLPGDQQ
jgi:hypothetical protein